MKTVLVTGGAGYIGSHMIKALMAAGYRTVCLDNLSEGHSDAVLGGDFVEGDLRDPGILEDVFSAHSIDLVMHFASRCYVGESVNEPAQYYANNVVGSLNLLQAMRQANCGRIVFSSSCTVYGHPMQKIIDETHRREPVSPYGHTKLIVETALANYALAYGLSSIALRYFNAAGADPDGGLGERHEPETHLVPLVLREALRVKRGGNPIDSALVVNGNDFDTPDGTCIRDYVHVSDLCQAHLLAANRLIVDHTARAEAFNLGTGLGSSILEVIETVSQVTGAPIRYNLGPRRSGDPARLVANASRAREELKWRPQISPSPSHIR